MPYIRVYEVATFYTMFNRQPVSTAVLAPRYILLARVANFWPGAPKPPEQSKVYVLPLLPPPPPHPPPPSSSSLCCRWASTISSCVAQRPACCGARETSRTRCSNTWACSGTVRRAPLCSTILINLRSSQCQRLVVLGSIPRLAFAMHLDPLPSFACISSSCQAPKQSSLPYLCSCASRPPSPSSSPLFALPSLQR